MINKQGQEVKFDLGSQRSLFPKVVQLNVKHCWKAMMKISFMVYELKPFKDFILICISGRHNKTLDITDPRKNKH